MSPRTDYSDSELALEEVRRAVRSVPAKVLDEVAQELARAKVVTAFAGGREGLVLRGLVMRLYHAGADAHYVGEMTCPAVGDGDVLVLSSGPGNASMVKALASVARRAGARVLYFTAEPQVSPAELADVVVVIQAQTMANDRGSTSVLPMGSCFEIALLLLVDLTTNRVRELHALPLDRMRARHTNLE